jgi:hypothetical protein
MPTEVEISPMKFAEKRYQVMKGLAAGDRIITAAFPQSLDSDWYRSLELVTLTEDHIFVAGW